MRDFRHDLWLRFARTANERARVLGGELEEVKSAELTYPVQANEVFVRLPESTIERLEAGGCKFYRYGSGVVRLVASFATTEAEVSQLVGAVRKQVT